MTAFSVGTTCLMLIGLQPAIHEYLHAVGLERVYAAEADILTRDLSKTILERVRSSQRDSNVKGRTRTLSGDGSSLSGTDDYAVEDVCVYEADAEGDGTGAEGTAEDSWEAVTYLGTWTATAYCSCPICCGDYSTGYTASGTLATEGRTIACNSLPMGTQVLIDGNTYTVEDTGYSPYGDAWIDIFFESHDSALAYGVRPVDVYLVN